MTAVTVQFLNQGQPVVPDLGSVTYNLYGQDGGLLATDVPVTVPVASTQVTIAIEPQYEVRTLKYEKRTVVFSWQHNTVPYTKRYSYRLSAFLNYDLTANAIRSFLGLSDAELKDSEIDLISAYMNVENFLSEAKLDAALSAGGVLEQTANKAILYTACLEVLPSLRLRLAKERSDGPLTWKRFDVDDFNELEALIRALLAEALGLIDEPQAPSYTFITVSNPVDIITGA